MRITHKSSILCIAIMFSAQIVILAVAARPGIATQQNISLEDYAVLSRTIKTLYLDRVIESERIDLLVLEERTSLQEKVGIDLDKVFLRFQKEIPNVEKEVFDDLKTKNKQAEQLGAALDIPIKYTIVSKEDLKKSIGEGDPASMWTRFYKAYPNSSGLVSVSRVGFNRNMSQSLVYLERSCGPHCADGRIVFLTKEPVGWVVQKIHILWMI